MGRSRKSDISDSRYGALSHMQLSAPGDNCDRRAAESGFSALQADVSILQLRLDSLLLKAY
jgi:hypothetical protein